jgi:hypothetical protein
MVEWLTMLIKLIEKKLNLTSVISHLHSVICILTSVL